MSTLVYCGPGPSAVPADHRLILGPRSSPHANVFLDIERLHVALLAELPPRLRDLLDVATYVYSGDQLVARGGQGVPNRGPLGDGWRRRFCYHVPVRCPDFWSASPVQEALTDTLRFLSDDEYEWQFRPLTASPPFAEHLLTDQSPYAGDIDEVILCSGGLDSLGGAVHECVVEGRRVLLVQHRSHDKFQQLHTALFAGLRELATSNRPLAVPVVINKRAALNHCHLQRARSFLYASLAAVVAHQVGRDRIRFYENGVVSANLPLSYQVLGTRATRTTHPRVLDGFARLFRLVFDKPFAVENPFRDHTKGEIVRRLADAGGARLIPFTTSCAETRSRSLRQPHCGRCSRVSVTEVGGFFVVGTGE